jgi:hypothetical protein
VSGGDDSPQLLDIDVDRESSSGVLLVGGWLAPPAFKEARMNNALKNYA